MIKLDKIYTKGGDKGMTSLGNGKRVYKNDLRIISVGVVEELNAHIGMIIIDISKNYKKLLVDIQNDLFDVGADLIMPEDKKKIPLRIKTAHIIKIEKAIDEINSLLPPLKSFILPGGNNLSAKLHLARTVCRRCEINIIKLNRKTNLNNNVIIYINRLSDLLFVIARIVNIKKKQEILWKPGKNIVE